METTKTSEIAQTIISEYYLRPDKPTVAQAIQDAIYDYNSREYMGQLAWSLDGETPVSAYDFMNALSEVVEALCVTSVYDEFRSGDSHVVMNDEGEVYISEKHLPKRPRHLKLLRKRGR